VDERKRYKCQGDRLLTMGLAPSDLYHRIVMASSFTSNENAASNRSSQMNIEFQSGPAVNLEHDDQISLSSKNTNNDPSEFPPQPSAIVNLVHRWSLPRVNIQRTFSTFWVLSLKGANDAAYWQPLSTRSGANMVPHTLKLIHTPWPLQRADCNSH
jgi:hypothetical protein